MIESTTYHLSKRVKAEAYEVFEALGLEPSQAINLFIYQVAMRREMPFLLETKTPNAETIIAIEEANHPENLPSFSSVDGLLKSIDKEQ